MMLPNRAGLRCLFGSNVAPALSLVWQYAIKGDLIKSF